MNLLEQIQHYKDKAKTNELIVKSLGESYLKKWRKYKDGDKVKFSADLRTRKGTVQSARFNTHNLSIEYLVRSGFFTFIVKENKVLDS